MHADSGRGLQMLKKIALILPVFFFLLAATVNAQGLTFDRAYQDYQYNLTVYNNAFADYQDAKNAYMENQTLALKDVARQKTFVMLQDRDKLISVYLTALRADINEQTGLSGDDKNNIFGKIDPEVSYYNNHQTSYSQTDDLPTLFSKSTDAQNQYTNKTSLVVKESLFDISLGQVAGLRIAHETVYSTLKSIIDAGVAAGKLKIDPFNRWLSEIDTTDNQLKQNEATAKTQIAQIYTSTYTISGGYDVAIETLQSSVGPLGQYNEFLNEVLNYIQANE